MKPEISTKNTSLDNEYLLKLHVYIVIWCGYQHVNCNHDFQIGDFANMTRHEFIQNIDVVMAKLNNLHF